MTLYAKLVDDAQKVCDELQAEYNRRTFGNPTGMRGQRCFLDDESAMAALRVERDNILKWRAKLAAMLHMPEAQAICHEIGIPFTLE